MCVCIRTIRSEFCSICCLSIYDCWKPNGIYSTKHWKYWTSVQVAIPVYMFWICEGHSVQLSIFIWFKLLLLLLFYICHSLSRKYYIFRMCWMFDGRQWFMCIKREIQTSWRYMRFALFLYPNKPTEQGVHNDDDKNSKKRQPKKKEPKWIAETKWNKRSFFSSFCLLLPSTFTIHK